MEDPHPIPQGMDFHFKPSCLLFLTIPPLSPLGAALSGKKRASGIFRKPLIFMVGGTGIEPVTSTV